MDLLQFEATCVGGHASIGLPEKVMRICTSVTVRRYRPLQFSMAWLAAPPHQVAAGDQASGLAGAHSFYDHDVFMIP